MTGMAIYHYLSYQNISKDQNQGEYLQDGNPQGSYPLAGYPLQPGYSPQPEYPLNLGYPALPGYSPHSWYPPQPGYPLQPGYPSQTGYPPLLEYPPHPGYPPQPSTPLQQGNQAGYDDEPAGKSEPEVVDLGEDGELKEFDFKDQSIWRPFIRKVFFSLMCQLLITLGCTTLCIYNHGIRFWVHRNTWMLWVALGTMLVTVVVLICCGKARRQAPKNFICFGIFTVVEGFLLVFIAFIKSPDAVMMAVGATAAVCLALTMFTLQSKWHFTMIRGFLVCATVVVLLLVITGFFVRHNELLLVYASIGALIFSMYLVYDTQLMMGGKHKYSISPEEYIFAALNLYLDFFNIYHHIRCIGEKLK